MMNTCTGDAKLAVAPLLDSADEWAKIGRACLLRAMESTSAGNFATAAEYRRQSDEAFAKELSLRSVLANRAGESPTGSPLARTNNKVHSCRVSVAKEV